MTFILPKHASAPRPWDSYIISYYTDSDAFRLFVFSGEPSILTPLPRSSIRIAVNTASLSLSLNGFPLDKAELYMAEQDTKTSYEKHDAILLFFLSYESDAK
jgi:hypothetical protein